MTNDNSFSLQPPEVADVTQQLDDLAARIETLMRNEASNLTVAAPGRDEVSVRVASTLNDVHATYTASTDHGAREIREIAATLRAHTDHIVEAERDFTI